MCIISCVFWQTCEQCMFCALEATANDQWAGRHWHQIRWPRHVQVQNGALSIFVQCEWYLLLLLLPCSIWSNHVADWAEGAKLGWQGVVDTNTHRVDYGGHGRTRARWWLGRWDGQWSDSVVVVTMCVCVCVCEGMMSECCCELMMILLRWRHRQRLRHETRRRYVFHVRAFTGVHVESSDVKSRGPCTPWTASKHEATLSRCLDFVAGVNGL